MWAREARRQIERRAGGHDLGCWDFIRDCQGDGCTFEEKGRSADTFWSEMRAGTHCGEDWYEGSGDAHGWLAWPSPALLGFDDGIHAVCNNNCDGAGFSILELFSWRVPYNTCRNFEWQVCAAKGLLPNQDNGTINFATAPKDLDLHAYPSFGCCHGWTDTSCDLDTGFANDDIYYLEVCLFSQVCSNRDELFAINALDDFRCVFDDAGFNRLMGLLREGPADGKLGGVCDADLGPGVECMNEVYQQCGGNNFKGQRCCRPGSSCEGDQWYKQCRP